MKFFTETDWAEMFGAFVALVVFAVAVFIAIFVVTGAGMVAVDFWTRILS